jgi:hypothetical protein
MYDRLVAHTKKYNNTRLPRNFKSDPKLGRWVYKQRKCCIDKDQIDLLNGIRFEWKLKEPIDWMDMYVRLVAYEKKYNNTRVPMGWKEDPKLGNWVNTQRQYCKYKDRIDLLNNIGFEWKLREINDWKEMYERLEAYKRKHGTICVPLTYKADPKLGRWVKTQRRCCKDKDKDKIDLLIKIGFEWKVRETND